MAKHQPAAAISLPCIHLGDRMAPPPPGRDVRKSWHPCEKGHGQGGIVCACDCGTCPDRVTEEENDAPPVPKPIPVPESIESILADIRGPEKPRDEAWIKNPQVQEAHRRLFREFLENLPPDDHSRNGDGIVTCGGGLKYEMGIYLLVRMLRRVGCGLPVQVWHRGEAEPIGDRIRSLSGVKVVDATTHPARDEWRILRGWEMKAIACLWSGLKRFAFFDADCYPVADPSCLFRELDSSPAVLFPDYLTEDDSPRWASYGLERDGQPGINGGTLAVDLETSWRAFWLYHHLNQHSEFWYRKDLGVGGFGDQDQLRVAYRLAGVPFRLLSKRPLKNLKGTLVQAGPDGSALCVHRITGKPAPAGAFCDCRTRPRPWPMGLCCKCMKKNMALPMENEVWKICGEFER